MAKKKPAGSMTIYALIGKFVCLRHIVKKKQSSNGFCMIIMVLCLLALKKGRPAPQSHVGWIVHLKSLALAKNGK